MTRPRIGSVIGSYRLEELIGEGGMGRVYRARHVQLGREVALKMLRSEHASNRLALERFFAEARAVNMIAHEHIVEITDLVADPDVGAYYIMELLYGQPLAELCQREAPLPLERWVPLAVQICDAMVAIHGAGIVHRDLKPENIFLVSPRGRSGLRDFVKLLDFGIAKFFGADSPISSLPYEKTAEGTVVGTPSYMSPEQAAGREVDHRSDLFSLGIIMFQLATGKLPFVGGNFAELLVCLMTEEPPRPSELEPSLAMFPALDELILACLQKDPSERPQSAAEVLEQLHAVLAQLYTGATELLSAQAIPSMSMPAYQSMPMRRPEDVHMDGSSRVVSLPSGILYAPASKPSPSGEQHAPAEPSMAHVAPRNGAGRTTWRARIAVLVLAAAVMVVIGIANNRQQSPTGMATASPAVVSSSGPEDLVQGIAQGTNSSVDDSGVVITFESSPPDADVFWVNGDMTICRTPCALAVNEPLENNLFEIRREGYEPQRSMLTAALDTHIKVALVERGSASMRPSKARKQYRLNLNNDKNTERGMHASVSSNTADTGAKSGKPRVEAKRKKPLAKRLQKDAVLDPFAAE